LLLFSLGAISAITPSTIAKEQDSEPNHHRRKVLLTELGYNRSDLAAIRPWDHRQRGDHAEEFQQRCLIAALRALKHTDDVCGAFLWKWFPGRVHDEDFLLTTPSMQRVIAQHWGHSIRKD